MSNNPGKRGKPAPWVKRADEAQERALSEYRRANHAAYAEWSGRRSEAYRLFMQEAGGISTYKAMKAADKRLRVWEKANPNPMTWDEYQRLEQEFLAQYKREDYS